ncbi:hypothetical protein HMPREF3038_01454 [Akkermansia sp. KLE1797]|nr:hypothetical protein HMPREF3038_01454 [Akkermansia sp. KLE1797]KXU55466.1 hypothetical protein HMPREF3039_00363 [Akkermansia sp. KLE1798]
MFSSFSSGGGKIPHSAWEKPYKLEAFHSRQRLPRGIPGAAILFISAHIR